MKEIELVYGATGPPAQGLLILSAVTYFFTRLIGVKTLPLSIKISSSQSSFKAVLKQYSKN